MGERLITFILLFAVCAVVIRSAVWLVQLILGWLLQRYTTDATANGLAPQPVDDEQQAINAIPVESARAQAMVLLRDPERFVCVPASQCEKTEVALLPDSARELFKQYDEICIPDGSVSVGPIRVRLAKGPFIEIGCSVDPSIYLMRPSDHTVFEVPLEEPHQVPDVLAPTIYHLFILADKRFNDYLS